MVIPVSGPTAQEAYATLRTRARDMVTRCDQLDAQLAAGEVDAAFLAHEFLPACLTTIAIHARLRTVPGLVEWAQREVGDLNWDVEASVVSSVVALQAVVGAILAEYPRDENGFLLDRKMGADGVIAWQIIPASSLTQTASAVTAFRATLA